jgi:superfamily II DNA or RNA helicase
MQLRDYQVELSDKATQILNDYGLVYLALEPRVGKTLTAFATAHKFGAKKVLFVTKKKAKADVRTNAALMKKSLVILPAS